MANMKNKSKKQSKQAKVWWFIVGEIHAGSDATTTTTYAPDCRETYRLAVKAPLRFEDAIAAWSDKVRELQGRTSITVQFKDIIRCGSTKPKDFSDSFNVVATGIGADEACLAQNVRVVNL